MKDTFIETQILERLQSLEKSQQLQVLNFATFLSDSKKTGMSGKTLLRFAGSIPQSELELMSDAIDQECGKIDLDEW